MEADDLLCSRNARPQKVLVGRAQWKINQPPSPEERPSPLGGIIESGGAVRPEQTKIPPPRCSGKINFREEEKRDGHG